MKIVDMPDGALQVYDASGPIGRGILLFTNFARWLQGKPKMSKSHVSIKLSNPDTGDPVVFESTWPKVQWKPAVVRLAGVKGVDVVSPKVPLTAEQNRAAYNFAMNLVGRRYNVLELFALIPYELSGETLPPPPTGLGKVCSVFAASVLDIPQIGWEDEDPRGVDPDDCMELSFMTAPERLET